MMLRPPLRPTLEHLPLPLLAMPMGLGGVGLGWRQAAESLGAPSAIGETILALTALVWLSVVVLQASRVLRHPHALRHDLVHPVRVAFVAAPTIGLMILAAALHPYAPSLAGAMWAASVALHLTVAMLLLRRIVAGRGEASMLAPPLLIPLVGNIVAPAVGARMGFADVSWMMFGVGFVLWLAMLPLLLHRLIAGPPLPAALRPSLVILLAPPAVGAAALHALTGEASGPAMALTGVALLVAAVLLSLGRELARIPFGLAWWATTFPTAAFAVMLMVQGFPALLCWPALLGTTALTGGVAWRTLHAGRAGAFYRPE